MKSYTKPEIKRIILDTSDIMTTSPVDLTDKVTPAYGSWKDILNGLDGATSFGGYDDNGGFN